MFFVGDSAGHCLPLSRRGHPHRVLLRHRRRARAGGRARRVAAATRQALRALRRTSRRSTRWKFAWLKRWQDHVWRLRPRARDALVGALGSRRLSEWAFGHYLRIAPPEFALPAPPAAARDPLKSAELAA